MDKNRPLLQTADPRQKIEELSRQREPLYREVAHITIDTGRPNVQSMVQAILDKLQRFEKRNQAVNSVKSDDTTFSQDKE